MSAGTWLTPREAAARAGVSVVTLRVWTRTRGLASRRPDGGRRQYLQSSLDAITDGESTGKAS